MREDGSTLGAGSCRGAVSSCQVCTAALHAQTATSEQSTGQMAASRAWAALALALLAGAAQAALLPGPNVVCCEWFLMLGSGARCG